MAGGETLLDVSRAASAWLRCVAGLVLLTGSWSCARGSSPPAPPQPQPPVAYTIADAAKACADVQASIKIPVSCGTDYVEGVPSMFVGFRSVAEAGEWFAPFTKSIGEPFCEAANRNGREARVYFVVGVGSERRGRQWSCELSSWGEWFSLAREPSAPGEGQTVADAIQACNRVQEDRSVPITCTTEYLDGAQTMIVGFRNGAEAESYAQAIAQQVAGPFCRAANSASRRASFVVTLADSVARHFDCEQQRWGEWVRISREPQIPPGVLH